METMKFHSNSLNLFDTKGGVLRCRKGAFQRKVHSDCNKQVWPIYFNLDFTAQTFLQRKETKLFQLHRSPTSGFLLAELALMHSKILN